MLSVTYHEESLTSNDRMKKDVKLELGLVHIEVYGIRYYAISAILQIWDHLAFFPFFDPGNFTTSISKPFINIMLELDEIYSEHHGLPYFLRL